MVDAEKQRVWDILATPTDLPEGHHIKYTTFMGDGDQYLVVSGAPLMVMLNEQALRAGTDYILSSSPANSVSSIAFFHPMQMGDIVTIY